MSQEFVVSILGGPVTVAYKKSGREWHCTALEFDLLGTGTTKSMAFDELKSVVNEYLLAALQEDGEVEIENPAPESEWKTPERHCFQVAAICLKKKQTPVPDRIARISRARKFRDVVKNFDLAPAQCS